VTASTEQTLTPSPRELADLEMLLDGGYAPLTGFPRQAEVAAGRLDNGVRWPVPVTLTVPDTVQTGSTLTLTDPEGAPLAELQVTETWVSEDLRYAAGPVSPLKAAEFGPFRRLRLTAAQTRQEIAGQPAIAQISDAPLTATELTELRANANRLGARILLLPAIGEPRLPAEALIKATLAAQDLLPAGTRTVPIPLSKLDNQWLLSVVARNYGASYLYAPGGTESPGVLPGTDNRRQHAQLDKLLDNGTDRLPTYLVPAEIAQVLRTARPPRHSRGVVVFLTGLSGSGKSTVARGVADTLAEITDRTVTLLDGDIVRRLLSAGLTFSRADRDLNIARIGFVAAEVAHHGGIAICAPIAPYAAARAEVRERVRRVGDFLLVHVATPLEVCEARDRKGLYAKARAGIIPEFTGISDPYEIPEDADLSLDTSEASTMDSVDQVIQLLTGRGYLG
jgi:sulfate adenylyltransferase